MVTRHVTSVPDGRRQALLTWVMANEFNVLLEIVSSRIAAAVSDHTEMVLKNATRHIKGEGLTAGELESLQAAAEWTVVKTRLLELRTLLADTEVSVTIGKQLTID